MAKVLLIDDAKFARSVLRKHLETAGYTVCEGENGEDGVAQFVKEQPDVVVCDLLMPIMDGFQVLEELKVKQKIQTPIIILTANIQVSAKNKCLALGADSFLNKPPKVDELLAEIEKYTG